MRYRAPSGKGHGDMLVPKRPVSQYQNTGCSDIEVKVGAGPSALRRQPPARCFNFWLFEFLAERRRGISRSSVGTVCARKMSFYTALNTFMLIFETGKSKGEASRPGDRPALRIFHLLLIEVGDNFSFAFGLRSKTSK